MDISPLDGRKPLAPRGVESGLGSSHPAAVTGGAALFLEPLPRATRRFYGGGMRDDDFKRGPGAIAIAIRDSL